MASSRLNSMRSILVFALLWFNFYFNRNCNMSRPLTRSTSNQSLDLQFEQLTTTTATHINTINDRLKQQDDKIKRLFDEIQSLKNPIIRSRKPPALRKMPQGCTQSDLHYLHQWRVSKLIHFFSSFLFSSLTHFFFYPTESKHSTFEFPN